MLFYLTSYIYPIKTPIILSKELNIILDNPRNKEEIDLIERNIKVSFDSPDIMYKFNHYFRFPIHDEVLGTMSLETCIKNFYNMYKNDDYVQEHKMNHQHTSIIRTLATMWLIIRFDDNGEINKIKDIIEEENLKNGFVLLDDNNPIEKNAKTALDYSFLLSLLIQDDPDYYGESIIIHKSYNRLQDPKIDIKLNRAIAFFGFSTYPVNQDICKDALSWKISFPCLRDKIIKISKLIDVALSNKIHKDKLIYMGNLLKISFNDIEDEKYKLVTYVGILELLLTHNPNFNRFNVEDSINKQFQIKVATLVYLYKDRKEPIINIQKRLKIIYNQRSNIAHGNFKELNKYINNLSKKDCNVEYFEDLVIDTIFYIKVIILEYLKDPDFINFLKDS